MVRAFGLEAETHKILLSSYLANFAFISGKLLLLTNTTSQVMSSGSDSAQPSSCSSSWGFSEQYIVLEKNACEISESSGCSETLRSQVPKELKLIENHTIS